MPMTRYAVPWTGELIPSNDGKYVKGIDVANLMLELKDLITAGKTDEVLAIMYSEFIVEFK